MIGRKKWVFFHISCRHCKVIYWMVSLYSSDTLCFWNWIQFKILCALCKKKFIVPPKKNLSMGDWGCVVPEGPCIWIYIVSGQSPIFPIFKEYIILHNIFKALTFIFCFTQASLKINNVGGCFQWWDSDIVILENMENIVKHKEKTQFRNNYS